MNRVCLTKDGKLIEMQSGGKVDRKDIMEWSLSIKNAEDRTEKKYQEYLAECDALEEMRLNTLKQNALNAGCVEADIKVRWVTEAEYAQLKAADPNEVARIAEAETKRQAQLAKAQEIITNLPDWATVKTAINAAFPDTKQNNLITKALRVVYILARTEEK